MFFLGVLVGAALGAVVLFFVFLNNEKKIDTLVTEYEAKLSAAKLAVSKDIATVKSDVASIKKDL